MKQHYPGKKQQNKIKGKFQPKVPKSKKIEQEFGQGKIDILICKKCGAVYWYKSWHHRLQDYPKLKETKNVKFVLCPACQMVKDKKYEGEIILKNVPESFKDSIKALIKSYGKRATEIDPMDRIISVKEKRVRRVTSQRKRGAASRKEFKDLRDIRILTTENQLAQKLAKKINETFGKKLSPSISHSHIEDVVRIKITF